MRALGSPPSCLVDAGSGALREGSFRGELPPVDVAPLAPRAIDRILREKRWIYVGIAAEEVYVALALVRLGYAANAFAFVYGKGEREMLGARKAIGLPLTVRIADTASRLSAAGWLPGARVDIARSGDAFMVEAELRELRVSARLDASYAPPSIASIAALPGGAAVATEKRALLGVTGEARIGGRRVSLDGGIAGYDYTSGLLPRRTHWRWGFALGRAESGERIGLNLVEGMSGEAECALWVDGELAPLAEGRFSFDAARPLDPWRVRTDDGAVDLCFTPGAMYQDRTDLGLLRARFLQPAGTWAGRVRAPDGRALILDGVLGVAEDQDMLW